MELRQLRYFAAVAEELHFGRAAARLNMTQPPLSQQIMDLEKDLGVKLFERNKRRVSLTEPGAVFLTHVRQILGDLDTAVGDLRRAARGEIGLLEIGHSPSADLVVLPRIISRFRTAHPHVELRLHVINSTDQVMALETQRIQIGVVRLPMEHGDHRVLPIYREPLVAVLPKSHPLAVRTRLPLAALAHERVILFPRQNSPGYFDLITKICLRAGFILKVAQECESIQTVMSLVAMGLGVSLQPASVRRLKIDGVVIRPLSRPVPTVEMGIAYLPSTKSRLVQEFVATAVSSNRPRSNK